MINRSARRLGFCPDIGRGLYRAWFFTGTGAGCSNRAAVGHWLAIHGGLGVPDASLAIY